ncbi:MAG: 16S rRNA (uracil(1498)-N(3))-methyltransferase [Candidatus Zixiibacteriota bacterium]|nr:MAG: 16S rRNA (uracil(1498)-N(3))-methyltransferase [candidate division Zixibacteria bacterium]
MMIPVFYVPPDTVDGETVVITGSEAHHLRRVMRLKKGDPVMVIDGVGNACRAEIEKFPGKDVRCRILSRIRNYGEPVSYVTLAAGLSTGMKFDEVIQRATELGVSRIIPVISEKSKVKLDDDRRVKIKLSRWRKVAIAAMKQTGRALLPEIAAPAMFPQVLGGFDQLGQMILFDPCYGSDSLQIMTASENSRFFTLFVGPESGFSRAEVDLARDAGASVVSLGRRVLRTENAAPVVLALAMYVLGEFN